MAHLSLVGADAGVKMSIYTASSGLPGSSLYVLTNPGSFSDDSRNTFTAPANATLEGNTDYFVVFENTNTGTGAADEYSIRTTASASEDPGAANGWSIHNSLHSRHANTWTANDSVVFSIAIKGQEALPGYDSVWSFTGSATPAPGSVTTYTAELSSGTLPPNGFVGFYFPTATGSVRRLGRLADCDPDDGGYLPGLYWFCAGFSVGGTERPPYVLDGDVLSGHSGIVTWAKTGTTRAARR